VQEFAENKVNINVIQFHEHTQDHMEKLYAAYGLTIVPVSINPGADSCLGSGRNPRPDGIR
jgi:hypothetical protein